MLLQLGLWEFGQDFDSAAPPHDTTSQTQAPNDIIYSKWQQPYGDALASFNISIYIYIYIYVCACVYTWLYFYFFHCRF